MFYLVILLGLGSVAFSSSSSSSSKGYQLHGGSDSNTNGYSASGSGSGRKVTLRLTSVFGAQPVDHHRNDHTFFKSDESSTFSFFGQTLSPRTDFVASPGSAWLRVATPGKNESSTATTTSDPLFDNPEFSTGFTLSAVSGKVPKWSAARVKPNDRNIFHKDMLLPNASDPQTVLALARMTSNSYAEPGGAGWVDIPPYNLSDRFGWTSDGIRGYVFADDANDLLVIALKGTSLSVPIVGGGPTAPRDKFNDNMMFSCCCGKVKSNWSPVCECADSATSTCDMNCLYSATSFSNSYYNLANTIYMAVSLWYPSSKTIWLTGHSLGGALASLVGLTHDLPVFAYEAPGDFITQNILDENPHEIPDYSSYLSTLQIYHFGNVKDPIYMGECLSSGSLCWIAAYALESKCHSGKKCVYDNKGSDLDMRWHSIDRVIQEYLVSEGPVPECKVMEACGECEGWSWKG
ncbi:alpha/beta-hydrolase [Rhizoclosmatium globosum]|uniref:triacylglycerol lipase n=1 Tax=Rhizoclosmatium globosum TaxID=329046 RepID=A0A1Y2BQC2_9FUNG|nr:alpha/beta-hydrolase [Rhizoclosmatium globosum]|eukprot:ORY36355.1 alpha/beta-hydrolase [Rhizoclosmatium globosum]